MLRLEKMVICGEKKKTNSDSIPPWLEDIYQEQEKYIIQLYEQQANIQERKKSKAKEKAYSKKKVLYNNASIHKENKK